MWLFEWQNSIDYFSFATVYGTVVITNHVPIIELLFISLEQQWQTCGMRAAAGVQNPLCWHTSQVTQQLSMG